MAFHFKKSTCPSNDLEGHDQGHGQGHGQGLNWMSPL